MTPITPPSDLPAELLPLFERMNQEGRAPNPPSRTEIRAVTDWFYEARWHTGRADQNELAWVRHWMDACDNPALAEITDAVCVQLIESGKISEAIELAEAMLAKCADFSVSYTLALAQAAQGSRDAAIATLEHALKTHAPDALVAEGMPLAHIGQAWLDLAHLYQQNKSLFKAIGPAKRAIALAQRDQQDDLLIDGLRFLVEQLIEQGGADEAWDNLAEFLSDTPSTTQLALWELAFMRLADQLSPEIVDRGAQLFLGTGKPDPLIKYLYKQAQATRDRDLTLIAFIIALKYRAPIDVAAPLAANLLLRDQDRQTESAPLIAAATMALAELPDERSIKRAHWHRDSMVQLISVAKHQGVPEAAVKLWAEDQRLYREHGIIDRAAEALRSELETPPAWLDLPANPQRTAEPTP
ncbi:hypothetical protein A9404_11595 [Halothiobacillus diazotrophicus]|uniref:Uncharacterized protein n=1 Tax=Halothiobacillus diazotrophicus TaxID=1860122 RepID=A0A191ZJ70_9GAMM|nr:hypothetical protein [Halothiobacillus diazotrophicus]ANJ67934.1 hypothetical protein A9404_11595 [Halothiobacillus diazotrophicus]